MNTSRPHAHSLYWYQLDMGTQFVWQESDFVPTLTVYLSWALGWTCQNGVHMYTNHFQTVRHFHNSYSSSSTFPLPQTPPPLPTHPPKPLPSASFFSLTITQMIMKSSLHGLSRAWVATPEESCQEGSAGGGQVASMHHRDHYRLLEVTRDYWITGDYWILLGIKFLEITSYN